MDALLQYFIRIAPGTGLIALTFLLVPVRQVAIRVLLLIMGFILMRDAMTPAGFWRFGITDTAIWLRFTDDALVLLILGGLSLAASLLLLRVRELGRLVRWGATADWRTYAAGLATGGAVALPFVLAGLTVPIELRGGANPPALLPVLLFFALVGNFLEELLFRGFLQSHLEEHASALRAAIISGLLFAVAHVYLASTVTDLGWPLLVFVLAEGLACAFVYRRFGLISAALVHGTVIFVLSAGLH